MIIVSEDKTILHTDLNKLVTETFKKPYNFQQQDNCRAKQTISITVPIKSPTDFSNKKIPYDLNSEKKGIAFENWLKNSPKKTKPKFDYSWENSLFWLRNFYPHLDMVLNNLHEKKLIDSGTYNLIITW